MVDMVEVKTAELAGPALDWAVAKTQNNVWPVVVGGKAYLDTDWDHILYTPSTNWAQGGPLLDKYPWALPYKTSPVRRHLGEFEACTESGKACSGGTPLIAACRVIVAAMLGGVVLVPAEMVGCDRGPR